MDTTILTVSDTRRRRLLQHLLQNETTMIGLTSSAGSCENIHRRSPPPPSQRPNTAIGSYQGSRIIGHIYGYNARVTQYLPDCAGQMTLFPHALHQKVISSLKWQQQQLVKKR